jgi:hypothetical protein
MADQTLPDKLERVLKHKDDAHYSPGLISDKVVKDTVRQARALVQAAAGLR